MYTLLKPLLFSVDAELAHDVSLDLLQQFELTRNFLVLISKLRMDSNAIFATPPAISATTPAISATTPGHDTCQVSLLDER